MISFMHMSNMLSEQLKQQYKSKSVYWRQEKEKLLQTFQPKQNGSQSQQKSRTSERKSKIRNLVDSLYNQGTPDKNKSIYYQFQSQITQQVQQQQSSTKKSNNELTLSTIISKYQRQVENCNNNHVVHDPIAEQIIESFQQLKKQSAKKPELQKCQSDQKIVENSAHKINIIGRINQIREFIDSQLGPSADDTRKDTKHESEGDYSSVRNKSVEFRQFLDQKQPSVATFNHRINKRRSVKSCTTLDVGIQVTLLNEDLIAQALQQFNSKNHSHILVQQGDHQSGRGSEKSLQEQIQSFQVKNTQQQTSPMNTQSPFYQVEQSVTSEYTLPLQQMLQQQRLMEEDLDIRSKNSGRMSRRSEFLREQEKGRFSANLNEFNKERDSVNQQGERPPLQERFSVPLNENFNQEQILKKIDFNAERVSVKSNELVNINKERQSINRDRLSINKERFSVHSNFDQENKERPSVHTNRIEVGIVTINNASNKENFLDFQQKIIKEELEPKLQESKLENRLNQIEIPKIVHALNFDNFELNKPNVIQQTSVDTNRFQIEIQQIMAKQNETFDFQFQKQEQNNTIQQDFILTSNRSQLSVPITEPPLHNNNYIIVEEEIEAAQPDIRIIENATGITEGNLQYSEDTANQRIVTQMSNNQEEQKFKVDSYVTCDIQFKKQGQQINQLQSTQSNQLNQSSFEQWLQQGDHNKKIFNFNCQSQYFQKEKCDHSTQINNKSDSESDEEIQFIKKKQQENQSNQGITLLVRKISSIMQIRLIKAFFELKEHSIHHNQSQQQYHSCRQSLNTYHSPIMSQFTSQYSSHQQSQLSLPPISQNTPQTQEKSTEVIGQQIPQVPKVQAAQEKISNLLKTIMEETGSDTLRMLKYKQSTSPQTKQIEKVRQSSQKIKTSKKSSAISIVTSLQSPVQEINDRIKVNFIQEMGLESPVQKHTEHAELNDFSNQISHLLGPIAEPMEFQDVSVLGRRKKENKALVDSNIGSNQINNSGSEQKHQSKDCQKILINSLQNCRLAIVQKRKLLILITNMRQKLQLKGDVSISSSAIQRRDSNQRQKSPLQGRKLFQSHVIKTPQSQQLGGYSQQQVQGRSHSQSNVVYSEEVPAKRPIIQLPFLQNAEPTLFFQYPPVCEDKRPLVNARPMTDEEIKRYSVTCKVLGSAPYKCVLTSFEWAGFKRINEDDEDEEWNVQWGIGSKSTLKNMNRFQKINHFPGCWNMGRKDLLWINLSKFKRKFPKDYHFIPNTYLLQYDFDRFMSAQESASKDTLWIKKPCADSRGRGITMVSKKTKIKKDKNFLIMEYIANPHLINGFKYDLRVYVLISSFDPLRVYVYKEGLVRFATSKYSTNSKDLSKKYIHLTNFAVNKLSPNFVKNQGTQKDDEGSKWSHSAYRKKLTEIGVDANELFSKIKDVVVKTCIASEPFMLDSNAKSQEHRNGYFELYGFDVLIDENLKPWVLEVNVSPSLNSSSPLDKKIKTSLISDVLHLIGVPLWDKSNYRAQSPPKYNQRNLKEIASINTMNCQNRLSQIDINMLINTVEEVKRRGKNFSCVFPNPKTLHQYIDLFEFPRYNNKLIERFYQDRCNWLSRFT